MPESLQPPVLRVLVVEDSVADAELAIREIERAGYGVTSQRVDNFADLTAALTAGPWDLVISDYAMPHFNGLEALAVIKAGGRDVPFILVSGAIGEDLAVRAMKAGAHDYVMKDRLSRLGPAVERELRDAAARRLQRQAEADLRKMAAAVEQSPSVVVITDLKGDIEYVNPRFTELTGYTRADVQGQSPRLLKSGYTPPEEYARLWKAVTAGGQWRGEFHQRRKDGSLFHEAVVISPIRDESGRVVHYLKVAEDVTARRDLEAQLRHSQKMEAVGRLAGGVAHDFNNLLTVILGFTEFAMTEVSEGHPLRRDLEQVTLAGQRAVALTRQLLAFSRKQVLEPTHVLLRDLAREAEPMIRRLVGEDVTVEMRLTDEAGTVFVEPGQIDQVIMNLVVNARDAMPRGGVLSIETSRVDVDDAFASPHGDVTPGPHALIAVTDSGEGMDEATQARLFEPFFTTKGVGKGTGLGLSTVYGIVTQSGGAIQVVSAPGEGTTFRVYLPLTSAAGVAATPASVGAADGGSETIVIVDDEAPLVLLAKRMLEKAGYTVLTAVNAGEALLTFERYSGPIQLLVTDVVMPQMNGRELAERLSLAKPGLKVLYVSGYTDDIVSQRGALKAGPKLLRKPFSTEELLRKVRATLDEAPA